MSEGLVVATTGALAAVVWFLVVAVVWVLLYRAAFPPGDGAEPGVAAHQVQPASFPPPPSPASPPTGAPEPLVDTRPRVACPQCGELVLVEARLCRFCGYRFAEKL